MGHRRVYRRSLRALTSALLALQALLPADALGAPLAVQRMDTIRDKMAAFFEDEATKPTTIQTNIDTEKPTRLAQWYNWGNWPNWGNWGNWPNWGNWYGWLPRAANRWRWPRR